MPANLVRLVLQPQVLASPGDHEGIQCHGVVQQGLILSSQSKPFSETVQVIHEGFPPLFNLHLSSGLPPSWCPSLQIIPGLPVVPPIPGILPAVFAPGIPPVVGVAPPGTTATPLPIFGPAEAQAMLLAALPGGIASWSTPGTIHSFTITGTIMPGLMQGLYKHFVYLKGSYDPAGASMLNMARVAVAVLVQGTN